MIRVIEIIIAAIFTILSLIKNPLYWIVILLVFVQYKRIVKIEKQILGINKESIYSKTFKSALFGIIGGFVGSIIIILLGITIEANDFKYIFILAVILMLIHPRFICFSYSGGLISILSIIIGVPKVNVSSIMAIVAILHLIESILILVDGQSTKIPIFIERDNKIVGGFNMVRFWPIPFIVLIAISQSAGIGGLQPSEWWPIFKAYNLEISNNIAFFMVGIIAALGYSDMAITDFPKNKVKISSRNLLLFSCILLFLALLSSRINELKIIAALFSPIAHEILIQMGRKKEKKGKPIFTPSSRGIRILDIIPKGIAHKIGIQPGDVILSLNGYAVNNKEEVNKILFYRPSYIIIKYISRKGVVATKEIRDAKNGIKSLGILAIPVNSSYSFIAKEIKSPIIIIFRHIKNKISKKLQKF